MTKHGAIGLGEDVLPDLQYQVRPDPEDVSVEGRVVEGAEGGAVRHDRLPAGVIVRDDVGSL
jgi:hypothetical protein